jgi:hypothetical protein
VKLVKLQPASLEVNSTEFLRMAPKNCDEFLPAHGAPLCDVTFSQPRITYNCPHPQEDTGADTDALLEHVLDNTPEKQMVTHMVTKPDDINPGQTASNSGSHMATSDHHAKNTHYQVENDSINAASHKPSMALAHLLLGSKIQTRHMLNTRDAYINTYFTDTANHDPDLIADSDTYNGYEDTEEMDTTTTIMSANSYDLADDEYNKTLLQNKDWIAVHINFFAQQTCNNNTFSSLPTNLDSRDTFMTRLQILPQVITS